MNEEIGKFYPLASFVFVLARSGHKDTKGIDSLIQKEFHYPSHHLLEVNFRGIHPFILSKKALNSERITID
jgi:hypothetical protein